MISPYMLKCSTGGSAIRKMDELAQKLAKEHGDDKIHNFTIGNPRVPPPQKYFDVLKEVASTETPLCHGYSSTRGDEAPREALAKLFTEIQGVPITKDCIVLSSGCAGAINIFLRTILNVGDEVILTAPYFLEYPFYIENWHATVTTLDTSFEENWQINPEKLEKLVNPLTRAIIINSPHNPTGTILSQETVHKMCQVLEKKSKEYGRPIYVISDDVYCRVLAPGAKHHQIFKEYKHSCVCYSLSKDLSIPGERIGCVVMNPLLENYELLVHSVAHSNEIIGFVHANRLHMRIIPKLLPATSDLKMYDESRELICKAFDEVGMKYVKPEGAFYVFPKIPDGINEWAFCEELAKNFVIVVPGSAFAKEGFFRLSFCKPPEQIKASIPVLKKALQEALKLKK
jgi:aspartate aminotransferase